MEFDSDAAVGHTLEGPLAIHGKMIDVKRAQPRKDIHDNDGITANLDIWTRAAGSTTTELEVTPPSSYVCEGIPSTVTLGCH